MAQVYQSASFKLGHEVVTLVMVAHSALSTDEMARRSFSALQPYFPNSVLVLCCQSFDGKPQFLGPRHVVAALNGKTFADFRWAPIAIT